MVGRVLAQASHDREEILTADIDSALVETTRQHWRNLHRFTDYKRFSTDAHEEVAKKP